MHVGGFLSRLQLVLTLDDTGRVRLTGGQAVDIMRLWRTGDGALWTCMTLTCLGMVTQCIVCVLELCEHGLGGFRHSWRRIDLVHNLLFLVVVGLFFSVLTLTPSPRDITPSAHAGVDVAAAPPLDAVSHPPPRSAATVSSARSAGVAACAAAAAMSSAEQKVEPPSHIAHAAADWWQ